VAVSGTAVSFIERLLCSFMVGVPTGHDVYTASFLFPGSGLFKAGYFKPCTTVLVRFNVDAVLEACVELLLSVIYMLF